MNNSFYTKLSWIGSPRTKLKKWLVNMTVEDLDIQNFLAIE